MCGKYVHEITCVVKRTSRLKWCELWFLLYPFGFLYLSEYKNSHQNVLSALLEVARFTEEQRGLRRHPKVQSNTSCTAIVPIEGACR